jgi:hypothetical protein
VVLFTFPSPTRYFLIRIVTVSTLLNLMETCSFLMSPADLGARFGVSGTTFLSAVAFYFVTVEQIPRVGYHTRCDLWSSYSFFLLFGSTVENAAVFIVSQVFRLAAA